MVVVIRGVVGFVVTVVDEVAFGAAVFVKASVLMVVIVEVTIVVLVLLVV